VAEKTCFVISPIGAEGTEVRKHADDLFDFIIKRAMDKCNVKAFRADHIYATGKISDHMFDSILKETFVIAVLTDHNPNVFFELAVAQAAARPVIMMIQKGQDIPFDIRDLRCVHYDFDARPLMTGQYVDELLEYVQELERSNWQVKSIFGDLSPLGAKPAEQGEYKFCRKSDDFGTPDAWLQVLQEAEAIFDVMGISLGAWKRGKGFSEALLKKAGDGCKVRVLLMHQDNPGLPCLINDAIPEIDSRKVMFDVEEMFKFFTHVAQQSDGIEVRRILRGCPHFQITRTDHRALCIQYLFSQKTGWSPLWESPPDSPLYKLMAEEFDLLWQVNEGQ